MSIRNEIMVCIRQPAQTVAGPVRLRHVLTLLLSLVCALSIFGPAQGSEPTLPALAPTPLFTTTPPTNASLFSQSAPTRKPKGPWVRHQRPVIITPEAIRMLHPTGTAQQVEMTMDLHTAGTHIADLKAREDRTGMPNMRAWTGKLRQVQDSDVTIVMKDNVLAGSIRTGHTIYEIRPSAAGQHDLIEIDADALPSDHHPVPVTQEDLGVADALTGAAAPGSAPAVAIDAGALIDVMVVYTTAAKNANGGQTGIEALITLAVTLVNQAFTNSQINTQFRLVRTGEVTYTESGNYNTDLSRLRSPTDGFMDEVHGWRDQSKADLVSLIEDNLGGVCGVAYVMAPVNAQFSTFAFSLVQDSCVSGYTFAHELGHNMGSMHDRTEGGTGAFPYSYGHRTAGQFRTIMAATLCTPSCPRVNHYSNPNVRYQNTWATGIDDNVDPVNSADNARAFTNALNTVANFRNSGDTTAPTAPANLRIIGP